MINLFLIGYVLPLILSVLFFIFFDEDVIIVKDLLNNWLAYIVPILNIFFLFVVTMCFIENIFRKIKINKDFLNYKFKKFGNLK